MRSIVLPKLNNNDETCILVEWLCKDGQRIAADSVIAIVETSKATDQLVAESEGILHIVGAAGREYPFGTTIGYVFEDEAQRQSFLAAERALSNEETCGLTVTRGARELMEAHDIGEADVLSLGKHVIKRADVEALLHAQARGTTATLALPRRQQSIAETVSRSHATIPKAFLLMRIYCDAALEMLRQAARDEAMMIGLPELLVQVTARLSGRFPFFFGALIDNARFMPAANPGIGVTLDLGKGLFIPVVRDAQHRSLKQIAEDLLGFRVKAMRDTFKQEDLSDGHITITLNADRDVVLALPIILPTQSSMISLGAVQTELYLDAEHNVATRSYVHIGLSYDHRVINGHAAVQFLKAIKAALETPDHLV